MAFLGLCLFWDAGMTYAAAQTVSATCSEVQTMGDIQPLIDDAANSQGVCVSFKGDGTAGYVSILR